MRAALLGDAFDVRRLGPARPRPQPAVPDRAVHVAELAPGPCCSLVDDVSAERGEPGGTFAYAGDSVGGAVGLQLLLDAPDRVEVRGADLHRRPDRRRRRLARAGRAGPRVAARRRWSRARRERWFAPGFLEREPESPPGSCSRPAGRRPSGYAAVCEALAGFDVRDRLGEITAPVLAVAGPHDDRRRPEWHGRRRAACGDGRLVVLDGRRPPRARRGPASAVAALIREHVPRCRR